MGWLSTASTCGVVAWLSSSVIACGTSPSVAADGAAGLVPLDPRTLIPDTAWHHDALELESDSVSVGIEDTPSPDSTGIDAVPSCANGRLCGGVCCPNHHTCCHVGPGGRQRECHQRCPTRCGEFSDDPKDFYFNMPEYCYDDWRVAECRNDIPASHGHFLDAPCGWSNLGRCHPNGRCVGCDCQGRCYENVPPAGCDSDTAPLCEENPGFGTIADAKEACDGITWDSEIVSPAVPKE